jgi:hypothetical protein
MLRIDEPRRIAIDRITRMYIQYSSRSGLSGLI